MSFGISASDRPFADFQCHHVNRPTRESKVNSRNCSPPRSGLKMALTFDAMIGVSKEVSVMNVQFQTVDVFTDRQFGGNPLA